MQAPQPTAHQLHVGPAFVFRSAPACCAADIARLTAASAVDPASCAKLVDMRADELISNACAANPKCKELRDAAGVHGMASAAAALPSLM